MQAKRRIDSKITPEFYGKTHFDFKKFTIYHDKCAMKLGTDGVLLGAWTEVCPDSKYILDIGTGSGLIAIMLAQKCNAYIIGIDIDEEAVNQATDNGKRHLGHNVCISK